MTEESVETVEAVKEEGKPKLPPSWWQKYVGRRVALQFRQGLAYFMVTSPGTFLIHPETNMPAPIEFYEGVLGVEEDHTGLRIYLDTVDPHPERNHIKMRILMHPDVVDFVTVCQEESRIVAPGL